MSSYLIVRATVWIILLLRLFFNLNLTSNRHLANNRWLLLQGLSNLLINFLTNELDVNGFGEYYRAMMRCGGLS